MSLIFPKRTHISGVYLQTCHHQYSALLNWKSCWSDSQGHVPAWLLRCCIGREWTTLAYNIIFFSFGWPMLGIKLKRFLVTTAAFSDTLYTWGPNGTAISTSTPRQLLPPVNPHSLYKYSIGILYDLLLVTRTVSVFLIARFSLLLISYASTEAMLFSIPTCKKCSFRASTRIIIMIGKHYSFGALRDSWYTTFQKNVPRITILKNDPQLTFSRDLKEPEVRHCEGLGSLALCHRLSWPAEYRNYAIKEQIEN